MAAHRRKHSGAMCDSACPAGPLYRHPEHCHLDTLATFAAAAQQARLGSVQQDHERTIRTALRLLTDCGLAYEHGTDSTKRGYNQAWFDKLFIDARDDDHRSPGGADRVGGGAAHGAGGAGGDDR
jgi:hypothetical protein